MQYYQSNNNSIAIIINRYHTYSINVKTYGKNNSGLTEINHFLEKNNKHILYKCNQCRVSQDIDYRIHLK